MSKKTKEFFEAMLFTSDEKVYIGYGLTEATAKKEALKRSKDKGGPTTLAKFAKVRVNKKKKGSLPKRLRDSDA